MNLIHAFWLVAFAVAERIAIWPSLLICLASVCTSLRPRSSELAWLMKICRASGAVSASKETTLIPASAAFLSAGATAFASFALITIADTFCVVSVLMYGTCALAVASDGPTRWNFAPAPSTAFLPPSSEIVKYGLLSCLGRNATVSDDASFFAVVAVAAGLDALSLSVLSFVEPQLANASAAAKMPMRPIDLGMPLLTRGWWMEDGATCRGRERSRSARARKAAADRP